ncbi:MAG TPA: hypothetical protein VGS61_05100 [Acidimicrobiales bacterium]|nr:hypothetical protein [Acidimicrobiales bacterium]
MKGCFRFGRHEYDIDGVKHKVCRTHHPAIDENHQLTGQELADHYAAHRPGAPSGPAPTNQ